MTEAVIAVAVVLVVGLIVIALRSNHPWQGVSTGADIDNGTETRSDRLYGSNHRTAGPDADLMDPELLGGDQRPPETVERPPRADEVA